MYNLLVSGDKDAWDGAPIEFGGERCIREYTEDQIVENFAKLDAEAVSAVRRFPCIFAYESGCKKPPKFGLIRKVSKRQGMVRIEYEIINIDNFIDENELAELAVELDIDKWELNRTHWAVKDVNLAKELKRRGVILPAWARGLSKSVDIESHVFDVALSFPGEARALVEQVAFELERRLGPHTYFYDNNYQAQLARPSLDTLLQGIYRHRAKLVVVFLSGDYQKKEWCGLEFRAIKEIIMQRAHSKIMFIRMDDGAVDGVFKTDGHIDSRRHGPGDIAEFIHQRVELIDGRSSGQENV